jgi:hypothetical protein
MDATEMTTAPTSISALLDAELPGAATFRCNPAAPPWAESEAKASRSEPRLLTIVQAAEVVPLSSKQLYRVAARRGGPFRKVEGRLMAYEDDLHRWIKSHLSGGEQSEPRRPRGGGLAERVRQRREDAAT